MDGQARTVTAGRRGGSRRSFLAWLSAAGAALLGRGGARAASGSGAGPVASAGRTVPPSAEDVHELPARVAEFWRPIDDPAVPERAARRP